MEYRLFSNDWQGIDLCDLADELDISKSKLADHHLYSALYERWSKENFKPEPGWVEAKAKIASLIDSSLRDAGVVGGRLLSVGAGLGLVEAALLDRGWTVTLHECQPYSFGYLRRILGDRMPPTIVDSTIESVSAAAFDVILACSVTYAFDLTTYAGFLKQCRRVLAPNGLVIVWEHDAKFFPLDYAHVAVNVLRGLKYLKWGWIRGPEDHERLARKAGFSTVRQR